MSTSALEVLGSRLSTLQGMLQHKQHQLNTLIMVHDTRMDAVAIMQQLSTLDAQVAEVKYAIKVISKEVQHANQV